MSTPFTNKSVRKTSLSSLLQQRAGLTTMQPIILCPRNSSDVFQPLDGSQGVANNFGQSQSAASSNPSIVSPSALPQQTTGKNHYSHGGTSPEFSPVVPPCSLSLSITTYSSAEYKYSAFQSVGSLPTFFNTNTNNFMSVSDADVSSCSQTSTSSKQQRVDGPSTLLSTSKELKKFKNTIKDLLKSKR